MLEKRLLIDIIARVLNGQERVSLESFNFNQLYRLAKFHSVENFLYYGLSTSGEDQNLLNKIHQNAVFKSAFQDAEQEQLAIMLESNNIKHLFLKGSLMKHLYPSLDMRSMADLDILVEKNSLKKLTPLMKNIGYKVESTGGNHDVYYKQPFMNIEFHRDMIDESYTMSKYYHNIWDKVQLEKDKNYAYELSIDDFYIYMIAHAAKHYQNGGTGIRSIIDVYIYLNHYKNQLNWDYINNEFKKLKILQFEINVKGLAMVWFNNQPSNESIDSIEAYIFDSGTYGTFSHSVLFKETKANKTINKKTLLLKRAFPPFKTMVRIFPFLKYLPFLLPFLWFYRLIVAILIKRKVVKQQMSIIKNINDDDLKKVDVTEAMTEAIGVRPLEAYMGRDLLCVLESEEEVRNLNPNQEKVNTLDGLLLHVTAKGKEFDCVSRSFAPKCNVPEDPVCGSGHCHIIPFWAKRSGKNNLVAYQASPRGGILYCEYQGERVKMSGKAALYSTADINF